MALITGGGTGIGRVIALALARHGADLALLGRRREPLDEVAGEARALGRHALSVPADVRDAEAAEAAVGRVEGGWGAVVDIVLNGAFHMSRAAFGAMEWRGGGAIVNITTTYVEMGAAYMSHSGAAKAGVLNLPRSLAAEWGRGGIRVNAVAPGLVEGKGGGPPSGGGGGALVRVPAWGAAGAPDPTGGRTRTTGRRGQVARRSPHRGSRVPNVPASSVYESSTPTHPAPGLEQGLQPRASWRHIPSMRLLAMQSIDLRLRRSVARGARPLAVLVAAALVAFPGGVEAQSADAILQAASDRHQTLAGFCADFRQTVQNDILGQTTRSRGEICQLRPDRFEMRFSDPEGDRVVADGQYLWIYLPSADPGQVFQSSSAEAGGRFDLHREFLTEPGRRYVAHLEGEEQVNGRSAHVLALAPRVESPFLRARVWVDASDALIRKVEITEDEGFVRVVELSGMELNPSIPPERFRFEPPEGVQVIRR